MALIARKMVKLFPLLIQMVVALKRLVEKYLIPTVLWDVKMRLLCIFYFQVNGLVPPLIANQCAAQPWKFSMHTYVF